MYSVVKYILSVIILLFTAALLMGQGLKNLDILLLSAEKKTTHLTSISKSENHSFFAEDGRSDILLTYEVKTEEEGSDSFYMSVARYHAHFIPITNGLYKISQQYGGATHYVREKPKNKDEFTMWREGIRETSPSGELYEVGYSNDTLLLPVKVLACYNELRPQKTIYESNQLDEQPALTLDGVRLNLEEHVIEWLKKKPWTNSAVKEASGFVRFEYVVDKNGWISDVAVDGLNLNKKEHISTICSGINQAITEYYYLNDNHHRWIPGRLNGNAVAARQYLTIQFK